MVSNESSLHGVRKSDAVNLDKTIRSDIEPFYLHLRKNSDSAINYQGKKITAALNKRGTGGRKMHNLSRN